MIEAANKYNVRSFAKHGRDIPESCKLYFPGLRIDPTACPPDEFSKAVVAFQTRWMRPGERDGKLGPATIAAMMLQYEVAEDPGYLYRRLLLHPTHLPMDKLFPLYYNLAPAGKFQPRRNTIPRLLVVHWGGYNAENLYRYMRSTERAVSTHFGVDHTGVYQFLDIEEQAYHAGYVNRYSIGIDICQSPLPRDIDRYTQREVRAVKNHTDRGNKNVLSLDPVTAQYTAYLVKDLCRVLQIPYRFPRGANGMEESGPAWHGTFDRYTLDKNKFSGVVGHHHIATTKWDIACWWESLFGQ